MRIALVVLCVGAVSFLLRVAVALIVEWTHWQHHEKKSARLSVIPSQARGKVLVLNAAGTVGSRA